MCCLAAGEGKKASGPFLIDFAAELPEESWFAPPPRAPKSTQLSDAAIRRAVADGPSVYLVPEGEALEEEGEAATGACLCITSRARWFQGDWMAFSLAS